MHKRSILKKALVFLTCATLCLGALYGCGGDDTAAEQTSSQQTQAATDSVMEVAVTMDYDDAIDMGYEGEIPQGDVLLPAGSSAYDTLIALDCDIEQDNGFVESINGLGLNDFAQGSGWTYQVNGQYPDVVATEYVLQTGDEVLWSFYIPDSAN